MNKFCFDEDSTKEEFLLRFLDLILHKKSYTDMSSLAYDFLLNYKKINNEDDGFDNFISKVSMMDLGYEYEIPLFSLKEECLNFLHRSNKL